MTNLKIEKIEQLDDLYCPSDSQLYPVLELDCEDCVARCTIAVSGETPMSVFHGRAIRWPIPAVTPDGAERLLEEISPLLERLLKEYSSDYDAQTNLVGHLTDEGRSLDYEIEEKLGDIPEHWLLQAWDAGSYFEPVRREIAEQYGVTSETTNDELDKIAEKIEAEVEAGEHDMAHVIDGVRAFIGGLRDELAEEEDDE